MTLTCSGDLCVVNGLFPLPEKLKDAISYQKYISNVKSLLNENKTTGDDHSGDMLHYTRMNLKRMERWEKIIEFIPEMHSFLENNEDNIDFLVISEAWCGDAAHVLPLIYKMTEVNSNLTLNILNRDEHPDLMKFYLTNEKKAIPMVIGLNNTSNKTEELFRWGPNPKKVLEMKEQYQMGKVFNKMEDYLKAIQMWYNHDKSESLQREILALLNLPK